MVDQLSGTLFPDGPAEWLHTPHLKKLAARSVRFKNCYTASPLCAPGRASFMSGQLPSVTGVYDNAAEFPSSLPTYAHHLRRVGYQTALSGKMHFVGPDQLHGFEERLTTDIYPPDFGWTPDYRKPGERIDWWYHNMGSVTNSGTAEITNQLEYDDEVAYEANRKIYDLSRGHDERPWCLTVSFTHPHDPYLARKKYWDLYENCDHLLPEVSALSYPEHDPHSKRILDASDWKNFDISDKKISFTVEKNFKQIVIDEFQNENSEINPYYSRFKSHQFDLTDTGNKLELSFSTPKLSLSSLVTNLKVKLAVFPNKDFTLIGSSNPGNSTKIRLFPLFKIFGSLVPTSSILLLTISIA